MPWDKSLELGIPLIDEQHQEIFMNIDKIFGEEDMAQVLDSLETCFMKHFADEEQLMQDSHYAARLVRHKSIHDNYLSTFRRIKRQLLAEGDTPKTRLQVSKNVDNWFKSHIISQDQEFARFYRYK